MQLYNVSFPGSIENHYQKDSHAWKISHALHGSTLSSGAANVYCAQHYCLNLLNHHDTCSRVKTVHRWAWGSDHLIIILIGQSCLCAIAYLRFWCLTKLFQEMMRFQKNVNSSSKYKQALLWHTKFFRGMDRYTMHMQYAYMMMVSKDYSDSLVKVFFQLLAAFGCELREHSELTPPCFLWGGGGCASRQTKILGLCLN